jgi:hypothetical protein
MIVLKIYGMIECVYLICLHGEPYLLAISNRLKPFYLGYRWVSKESFFFCLLLLYNQFITRL